MYVWEGMANIADISHILCAWASWEQNKPQLGVSAHGGLWCLKQPLELTLLEHKLVREWIAQD